MSDKSGFCPFCGHRLQSRSIRIGLARIAYIFCPRCRTYRIQARRVV